jgi:hypothetical protein
MKKKKNTQWATEATLCVVSWLVSVWLTVWDNNMTLLLGILGCTQPSENNETEELVEIPAKKRGIKN